MKSKWPVLFLGFLFSCQSPPEEIISTDKLFSLLPPSRTGIYFQNNLTESTWRNHLVDENFTSGAGVGVGDINNDGLPDLYFTGNQVFDRLYLNKGDMRFEDITEAAGILQEESWSNGVTLGDVNNDGYLDIYICKFDIRDGEFTKNLLYINNGDLTFTEKAAEYGVAYWGLSKQASFIDYDLDGFLDLYVIVQPPTLEYLVGHQLPLQSVPKLSYHTDRLFKNMGNGTFRDVTKLSGPEVGILPAKGLSTSIGDYNNDGWPDIYVANDYEKPDELFMNLGNGKFENRSHQAIKHMSHSSMGSDVADYDNDGFLDIIVADMVAEDNYRIKTNMGGMDPNAFWEIVDKGWHYQYMFNTLQRNNGNGTFSEIAHLAGVSNTDWSWSALFADFDNDGWKDLYVTNGVRRAMRNEDFNEEYRKILNRLDLVKAEDRNKAWLDNIMMYVNMVEVEKIPDYIYKNNGDLTFTKTTKEWGFDEPTLACGAAYADLDLDGDIDLVTSNIDDYGRVYKNNAIENKMGNYLRIYVADDLGNPAYGARVKIFKNGKFWQMQELTNVRGYKSKSEDVAHFGLGEVDRVERVEIVWPNGKKFVKENVKANRLLRVNPRKANDNYVRAASLPTLFTEVTKSLKIDYFHKENEYDDYSKEILLPHKMSNFGPCIAVGDVDKDGLEDFYVGGAHGFAGVLFVQQADGTFLRSKQYAWIDDKNQEDLGAEFFDADNDGDLDLYVVSGGNEFEPGSEELQDRLYLNNGNGQFKSEKNQLPKMYTSGSRVVPADYDKDGDMDLFVGGRLIPGRYPLPAKSYILRNEGGKFNDVTSLLAPDLLKAGLITSAVWTDFSGDGNLDLVLVGEWTPVTLFENQDGKFLNVTAEAGLANTTGWYYSVVSEDFDRDGDYDLVVGNLGLNYKYHASEDEPFEVYSHDFDYNGQMDIVLGYHEQGDLLPLRGRSCSSQQMPIIAENFPTFHSFGIANLQDIYGPEIDIALNYKATTFATSYIENLGNGSFKVKNLPNEAQFSSVNSILVEDFNLDGHKDLLLSGNLFPVEIETPRNDAGVGLYLTGDGNGNFSPIPLVQSGFFTPNDVKDMKSIRISTGEGQKQVILVANNNYQLQAIQFDPGSLKARKAQLSNLE